MLALDQAPMGSGDRGADTLHLMPDLLVDVRLGENDGSTAGAVSVRALRAVHARLSAGFRTARIEGSGLPRRASRVRPDQLLTPPREHLIESSANCLMVSSGISITIGSVLHGKSTFITRFAEEKAVKCLIHT